VLGIDPVYLRFFRGLLFAYLAFVLLIYLVQRRLQYFPDASLVARPLGEDLKTLEEVTLQAADGVRIRAWYWPGVRPDNILMFHGNAGHRGHRIDWARGFHELGYGVFLLDYRGYGGSEGSPTEEGFCLDARAALTWLRQKPGRVIYLGESLGSGPAVELALHQPPAALILHAPFTSAVDVGRTAYPYLPVRLLLKDKYENDRKIAKVRSPVLIIHGERDSVIPFHLGRKLFELAADPKEWLAIPDADHNDLAFAGGRRYWDTIESFLEKALSRL
jgi:fermentation-respiration switch protein FrsA (DUF1100 family)